MLTRADPTRVLSRRELNRALLARQLLLERTAEPLPGAVERMAGVQAQYAPAMYIGLWSRVEGLQRDDLTAALEDRRVVQGTLMRTTIHLVSRVDYWPLALAIAEARREWFLRVRHGTLRADALAAAATVLRDALRERGPLRWTEICALVGKDVAAGVGLWLDLVRVPPSGTWDRRRADLFEAAETWVGPPSAEPDAAVDHLVTRYLGGFGPSSPDEIATWSGLPRATITGALDRVSLRHFRAEDGEPLVDVRRAPLPDPDTDAPVRFLAHWDASLLVHARRTGILPEQYRPLVFSTKNPQSVATFLVDGAVAGTWTFDGTGVRLAPFAPLGARTRRALEDEGERLAAFHSG